MNMNLGKLQEMMRDREAWRAVVHGVTKNWTWLGDWKQWQPMNNVVAVSDEQWGDSAIYMRVSVLPQSPLPTSLPHDTEQEFPVLCSRSLLVIYLRCSRLLYVILLNVKMISFKEFATETKHREYSMLLFKRHQVRRQWSGQFSTEGDFQPRILYPEKITFRINSKKQKDFFKQTKTEGLNALVAELLQIRDLDLHREMKSVRDGVNSSKIHFFTLIALKTSCLKHKWCKCLKCLQNVQK